MWKGGRARAYKAAVVLRNRNPLHLHVRLPDGQRRRDRFRRGERFRSPAGRRRRNGAASEAASGVEAAARSWVVLSAHAPSSSASGPTVKWKAFSAGPSTKPNGRSRVSPRTPSAT